MLIFTLDGSTRLCYRPTGRNMDTKMSHNLDTFSWKGLYTRCVWDTCAPEVFFLRIGHGQGKAVTEDGEGKSLLRWSKHGNTVDKDWFDHEKVIQCNYKFWKRFLSIGREKVKTSNSCCFAAMGYNKMYIIMLTVMRKIQFVKHNK
jgi:hypothetical protein